MYCSAVPFTYVPLSVTATKVSLDPFVKVVVPINRLELAMDIYRMPYLIIVAVEAGSVSSTVVGAVYDRVSDVTSGFDRVNEFGAVGTPDCTNGSKLIVDILRRLL